MSNPQMTSTQIAKAIVELVELAYGPVTLAQIEREVPGFAAERGQDDWSWVAGDDDDEDVIWDGMTEEGCEALRRVVKAWRVAMQSCPPSVYVAEGRWPSNPTWVPIVLVPASMANMVTLGPLIRGDRQVQDMIMARAADEGLSGFRVIGPPA